MDINITKKRVRSFAFILLLALGLSLVFWAFKERKAESQPEQEQLGFIQGATYTVLNYSGLDRDYFGTDLILEVQASEADNQLLFFSSGSQGADEVVPLREGHNVIPLHWHAPRGIADVSFKVDALHSAWIELGSRRESNAPLQLIINFYNPKEYNSVIYLDHTKELTSTRLEFKHKEAELEIEFQDYLGRTLYQQKGIARQGQFDISSFMSKEAALESGGATARTMILSSDFPLDFSLVSPSNQIIP